MQGSKLKLAVVAGALLALLVVGVSGAGADQTFKSGLYQNQPYTCAGGSAVDPSGQSFGTFTATETHNPPAQLVQGYVAVDNVRPNLLYHVFVTEFGLKCIQPTLIDQFPYQVAEFWVGANSHGSVHFTFWAHTGETSAWVTVRHGNVMTVRSAAVPINR
jgi:hypothetical protein